VRRPLFLLLLATFALKAAVLANFNAHPLLQPVGDMDSGVYARLAADVARGDLLLRGPGPVPFFVSPLYIYFLAAIHALSAGSLLAAKVVQIALGTAATGLVYGMTRRLFGDRAALLAGIFYALTGFVTFHEVLILQAALDPFLTALCLFLLSNALAHGSVSLKVNEKGTRAGGSQARVTWAATGVAGGMGRWLAAGAAFGLLALNRPNSLLCVPAIAVTLATASLVVRRRGGKAVLPFEENPLRTLRPVAAFLAATAAVVALPLARNLIVSGEPVLISSHGGLNFLVGNGPAANGVYRWLDGITPSIAGQATNAKRIAETQSGRTLTTREVSSFFARRARAWIASHPTEAARLFARKVWYVFSNDEMSLNFSTVWYRRETLLLRLLAVGPWLLVPLGGAGLALAVLGAGKLPGRDAAVWASFVPSYALVVAAFFVATRYRLPLVAPLAVGAGGALCLSLDAWRRREKKPLFVAACIALPLLALTLWPTGIDDGSSEEETQWVLHLVDAGDTAQAAKRLNALAKIHPSRGLLFFRAGQAWAAAGRFDDAIPALERSLAIDSSQAETQKVLSSAHERRGMERVVAGDMAAALPDLEEAARLDPKNATVRLNLAAILAERGDRGRARALAAEALALRPGYDKAEALLKALR
jgi:4-amino-4-deoxy-L-arabinose transferase-like glycosyltransferase